MKLRIRNDSVRVRLTQSEATQLGDGQAVHQDTPFLNGTTFRTALVPSDEVKLLATLDDNVLTIQAPKSALTAWANGDQVTLDCEQKTPPTLLIEKDYACLVPRDGGDDDDTFPHPRATTP